MVLTSEKSWINSFFSFSTVSNSFCKTFRNWNTETRTKILDYKVAFIILLYNAKNNNGFVGTCSVRSSAVTLVKPASLSICTSTKEIRILMYHEFLRITVTHLYRMYIPDHMLQRHGDHILFA